METLENGFIFIKAKKVVVAEFGIGEMQYFGEVHDYFYGTKQQAIDFGLIFKEEI